MDDVKGQKYSEATTASWAIQVHVAEFEALREVIENRARLQNTMVLGNLAAFAALLVSSIEFQNPVLALLTPPFSTAAGVSWLYNQRVRALCGDYIYNVHVFFKSTFYYCPLARLVPVTRYSVLVQAAFFYCLRICCCTFSGCICRNRDV